MSSPERSPEARLHVLRERIRLLRSSIHRIGGFCGSVWVDARYKRDGTLIAEQHLAGDVAQWQRETLEFDDRKAAETDGFDVES